MKFDDDARLDPSQVDDRRSGRRRSRRSSGSGTGSFRIPSGGSGSGGSGSGGSAPSGPATKGGKGLGLVIVVIVVLVVAWALTSGGSESDSASGTAPVSETSTCETGADANARQDCRIVALSNSIQAFWDQAFADDGRRYREAEVVLFTGRTESACGTADDSVGPFYCPEDESVYLDLSFFEVLQDEYGTRGGDFAEAYVLAHEFGHHVQHLVLGRSAVSGAAEMGSDGDSVRFELQADCYAGLWAHHATSGPKPLITELTATDIREGIDAAEAVGDDTIQRDSGMRIDRDTWTHGSSAQRRDWFETGLDRGRIDACDTFATRRL